MSLTLDMNAAWEQSGAECLHLMGMVNHTLSQTAITRKRCHPKNCDLNRSVRNSSWIGATLRGGEVAGSGFTSAQLQAGVKMTS